LSLDKGAVLMQVQIRKQQRKRRCRGNLGCADDGAGSDVAVVATE
jgi:hypothetical protein